VKTPVLDDDRGCSTAYKGTFLGAPFKQRAAPCKDVRFDRLDSVSSNEKVNEVHSGQKPVQQNRQIAE
jgi:hypothetical protein